MNRLAVSAVLDFLLLSHLTPVALCVVDLNPNQIQYVADHLTHAHCLKLLSALHEKGFYLHSQLGEQTSPLPLRQDSGRPCVVQLTAWCNGPGKDLTFDFLALRLKEIGLKKVADKLSRKVLGETSEELHRFFLDDPFKEMIPTKSIMLDKPMLTEKVVAAPDEEDKYDDMFIAVVVMATACCSFCLCVGVCLGCPGLGRVVCRRACPAICYNCFDVGIENCQQCSRSFQKSADKHLFASRKGQAGTALLI